MEPELPSAIRYPLQSAILHGCRLGLLTKVGFTGLMQLLDRKSRRSIIAGQVGAYRHAYGLPGVQMDARLNALAPQQVEAMASSETISHSPAGEFSSRVADLQRRMAAENIAAGNTNFSDTLKQWEDSAGHRENLLMAGARRIGVASVAKLSSRYRMFWAMLIAD